MGLIDRIAGPEDLKALPGPRLPELAEEIRAFLVENVSKTGGHLGPNLGVVELTIALHRVFDSPSDAILFDTGHQSYVHKILTGRHDFSALRREGGLSGYPSRAESAHDVVENSHATTALSWADGIARGFQLSGQTGRRAVAVVGDGAMTGGMAWEALNNIAEDSDRPLVVVINDNDRSYAPTVGGLVRKFDPVRRLDSIRLSKSYEAFLDWTKRTLRDAGPPGRMAYGALHSIKKGVKDIFVDAGIFDSLGLKYIGPIDGHNLDDLIEALTLARDYGGPVVVHAITEKGRGYEPAERDVHDRFHAIGAIHPETGLPIAPERFGWTSVFAREIARIARADPTVVGITAAMTRPVGLGRFADEFPDRVIDVGIAEQHALTASAGMAFAGLHPVVALYATFLNRAFDQVLMDVGLHHAGVTIVLDRAGLTGTDGASHNGMWDMALLSHVPGLRLAAPRDETTLREDLRTAAATSDGPTVLRYPKGALPERAPALRVMGPPNDPFEAVDVLMEADDDGPGERRLLLVAVGAMTPAVLAAGRDLADEGRAVAVVAPRWVVPIPRALVETARSFDGVVVVEDGLVDGGIGSQLRDALEDNAAETGRRCPVVARVGVPRRFLGTASRKQLLADFGMDTEGIAATARRLLSAV